jgi:Skp family chaperone for outer membrane proteins
MSLYADMADIGERIEQVQAMQDKALDMYSPRNEQLTAILKTLVKLEKAFDDLYDEYEKLLTAEG